MSDGPGLFGELIYIMHKAVSDDDSRAEVYEHMIDSFLECDTELQELDDCKGSDPVFDRIIKERFDDIGEPPETEEDED